MRVLPHLPSFQSMLATGVRGREVLAGSCVDAALRAALRWSAMRCRSANSALSDSVAGCRLLMAMALLVRGSLATNVNSATRLGSDVSPWAHNPLLRDRHMQALCCMPFSAGGPAMQAVAECTSPNFCLSRSENMHTATSPQCLWGFVAWFGRDTACLQELHADVHGRGASPHNLTSHAHVFLDLQPVSELNGIHRGSDQYGGSSVGLAIIATSCMVHHQSSVQTCTSLQARTAWHSEVSAHTSRYNAQSCALPLSRTPHHNAQCRSMVLLAKEQYDWSAGAYQCSYAILPASESRSSRILPILQLFQGDLYCMCTTTS